ncbi:hypothetical protein D3C72_2336510 [compost metagenome]
MESIWARLPEQTILVPSPQRVMMVLIWDAVRFWHSSSSTKVFWMLRPRMKLTDLNWMLAFSMM